MRARSALALAALLASAACSDDTNGDPPLDQGPGSELLFADTSADGVEPDAPAADGQPDSPAADLQPDGAPADSAPDGPVGDGAPDLKPEAFTLTVSKKGNGTGFVTSTPSGISCGNDCSEKVANGSVVTLHAAPTSGSTFCSWMGSGVDPACWEQVDCGVTVTKDTTVSAWFTTNGLCP